MGENPGGKSPPVSLIVTIPLMIEIKCGVLRFLLKFFGKSFQRPFGITGFDALWECRSPHPALLSRASAQRWNSLQPDFWKIRGAAATIVRIGKRADTRKSADLEWPCLVRVCSQQ